MQANALDKDKLARALELMRELKRRTLWVPLPGPQTDAMNSLADVVGFGGSAGGGKGLALDTPLPTPTGWVAMGEVQPGDWLLDDCGQPCQVIGVSPISNRDCFRLTFDDGASLVADDVHRWVTFDASELAALTQRDPDWQAKRRAKRPSRAKGTKSAAFSASIAARNTLRAKESDKLPAPAGTMRDTAALSETLATASGRSNHAIRVCGALALPEADLPVPPYTLGAWLGDGTSRNGGFTGIDPEIWERIERDGFKVRHYAWDAKAHCILGLKVLLRGLGVLGCKHIPETYLRASFNQRLELLQGLMDTDGHATTSGACEYDGVNETLVRGVLELALSLGIKATMTTGTARLNGRAISAKYRVKFTTTLPVFHLPRKAQRLPSATRRTTQFRYLKACEKVATVPTKCIAVDSPSRMYLAGRSFIPTHNTDLACGLAITQHEKAMIIRENGTELTGVIDRLTQLLGGKDGYNGQDKIWRTRTPDGFNRQIEFGSYPNPGDEAKYQGRPHDLLVYDEAANHRESAVRFLMGWLRTTTPGQRCRVLMTFNPPTTAEGRWIIDYFGPWLNKKHPNPAKPGELRWFATVAGKDIEVPDDRRFVLVGGERIYDFNPDDHKPESIIKPLSRTFIPSRVSNNPYLMGTGYVATLQALPEPLRSQMLNGDFNAGIQDDPWQVIPTAWVEAAMARWQPKLPKPPMDSLGVDVARGGEDNTVISPRHGQWYDELITYPGKATPNGPETAGLIIAALRDNAPIHIDVIGVGSSPYDFLREANQQVIGVNVAESATAMDRSGRLRFANQRSQLWWKLREALDPSSNTGIQLPNDPRLLADLTAPKWELRGSIVKVESRDEIVKRIGRSPDFASAIILAQMDTPKMAEVRRAMELTRKEARNEYDPYSSMR